MATEKNELRSTVRIILALLLGAAPVGCLVANAFSQVAPKPAGPIANPKAAALLPSPCCDIAVINIPADLVTAQVKATGQTFQFKVNDPTVLKSLRVGEDVWANFKTRKVSLDGRTTCCDILSFGSPPKPPMGQPTPPSAPVSPGAIGSAKFPVTVTQFKIQSFGVFPGPIAGGDNDVGQVILNAPAGSVPVNVQLSSDKPEVATVPAMLAIQTSTFATFLVTTFGVAKPEDVIIKAQLEGSTDAFTSRMTVRPAQLSVLGCTQDLIQAGAPARCRVWLDGKAAAPPGKGPVGRNLPQTIFQGVQVKITTNPPIAGAPATVYIAAANDMAEFLIATPANLPSERITVSASYGGVTKNSSVSVMGESAYTGFDPKVHGFHFQNINFPGSILLDIPLIGTVDLGSTSYGLCGGMTFAALDTFLSGGQAPTDTTPPASGTELRSYLFGRQRDSLEDNNAWLVRKFIEWMAYPDTTSYGITGLDVRSFGEFLDNIRPQLTAGHPVPLGVVKASVSLGSVVTGNIFVQNHQVLAIGYEVHRDPTHGDHWDIRIYDPNFPDEIQRMHTHSNVLGYQTDDQNLRQTGSFRGFFASQYSPKRPYWVSSGQPTSSAPVSNSPKAYPPHPATFPGSLAIGKVPTPVSVVLSPASVTGGVTATGKVTLNGGAPSNGMSLSLSSSDTAVATVAATIVVSGGATAATFAVKTSPVPANSTRAQQPMGVPVVISASSPTLTQGVVTRTATLKVLPPVVESLGGQPNEAQQAPGPTHGSSIIAIPAFFPCASAPSAFSRTGGLPTNGCVLLNGPATSETQEPFPAVGGVGFKRAGAGVLVTSSNPQVAAVPPLAIVPVGEVAGSFPITTVPVRSPTIVDISAHRTRTESDLKTAQLTVLPPQLQDFACNPTRVIGDEAITCTLGLSGPAYEGLSVPVQYSTTQGLAPTPPNGVPFAKYHSAAGLTLPTTPVASDVNLTVSASLGGPPKSVPLNILAPRRIQSLAVRVITADGPKYAANSDDVYLSIGPLGWKLCRWCGDLWGCRSYFEAGSDYTFNLDIPNDLTTNDILLLGLEKKGVGGLYNAPDSPDGAWAPHKITLYVNGAPFPDDSCCVVDQQLAQGHAIWALQLRHFFPNAAQQVFVRSLRLSPNPPLTQVAETLAYLTTKFGKDHNISGWLPEDVGTSCATGTLVRPPAVSTDGLATIDLQVEKMEEIAATASHAALSSTLQKGLQWPQVNRPPETLEFILDGNHGIAHARYLRIEYAYGGNILGQGSNPLPQGNQRVRICGDVYRDTDYENWFEIHPRGASDVTFLSAASQQGPQPAGACNAPTCAKQCDPYNDAQKLQWQVCFQKCMTGCTQAPTAQQ